MFYKVSKTTHKFGGFLEALMGFFMSLYTELRFIMVKRYDRIGERK